MSTVYVGSARSDERGKINGGKAGDQTGLEVSKQKWYKHSKGWRVLRCKIPGMMDEFIAEAMESACDNNKIGYDQNQRLTLYNLIKAYNFDPSKASTACETDCSALVRVCVLYALRKVGRNTSVDDFITSNLANVLIKTGLFEELTESKYTSRSDYLMKGDILVTKTKGHTVVVLNSGDKAGDTTPEVSRPLGSEILRNGDEGAAVKELQSWLIQLGYDLGKWGADGDFGDATEMAVRKFQKDRGCEVDGKVGPETLTALEKALKIDDGDGDPKDPRKVRIINGQCYVRSAPNTNGKILGVAREGDVFPYGGQMSENGWPLIAFENQNAWVSGKYSRLEE